MRGSVVLLLETWKGGIVAVRFPSLEAARDWEDSHEDRVRVLGVAPIVSRTEALR